ncbi:MAG TPA: hypothetical protein VL201_02435, partial [Patescibacteria group bacterium]|nr:hypothetical protein [Patescibacteria group bacterium]
MLHDSVNARKLLLLKKLSNIPRNISQLHNNHNLIEFVLHELCHEDCLNLKKAAYLIDNEDFNCLHGVAGIDKVEPFTHSNIWQRPDDFSAYMNSLAFNKKVRQLKYQSSKAATECGSAFFRELSDDLDMQQPKYYTLPLKYDNKGILLYEAVNEDNIEENDLING